MELDTKAYEETFIYRLDKLQEEFDKLGGTIIWAFMGFIMGRVILIVNLVPYVYSKDILDFWRLYRRIE